MKSKFEIVMGALCLGLEVNLGEHTYLIRNKQMVIKGEKFEKSINKGLVKETTEVIHLGFDSTIGLLINLSEELSEEDITIICAKKAFMSESRKEELSEKTGLK